MGPFEGMFAVLPGMLELYKNMAEMLCEILGVGDGIRTGWGWNLLGTGSRLFSFFFSGRNRQCMENMQGSILPMPTGVEAQVDWGLVARCELECS